MAWGVCTPGILDFFGMNLFFVCFSQVDKPFNFRKIIFPASIRSLKVEAKTLSWKYSLVSQLKKK